MSYFSNIEDRSSLDGLGCGSECSRGPCQAGMSGLNEWYEKEEEEEPRPPSSPPKTPPPAQSPTGSGSQSERLNGWHRSKVGLGFYGSPGPATSPASENQLLQNAIRRGIRNINQLTGMVFFARHPSRRGTRIRLNETRLVAEWRQIRDRIVRPIVQQASITRDTLAGLDGANKFDQCWEPQKRVIQAAFLNALRFVDNAAAVLGTAHARPDRMSLITRGLLQRHFHTTDRDNVFTIFRNLFRIGQALEEGLNFECETNCKSAGGRSTCGYTWATQWFGGYGDIHICFDNRAGFCSFAGLTAQQQAAVIIHEAAHRHVGIDDKAYMGNGTPPDPIDYSSLTSKQAMDNADSYAWFCVHLPRGG